MGVPMSARRREQESAAVMAAAPPGACKACAVEKLTFEPPPMYCANCNARIKPKVTYYLGNGSQQGGDVKQQFCSPCYNGFAPHFEIEGMSVAKSQLVKKKNEEDLEEPWVECDCCHSWVHQICTLFNSRRNEGGDSAFTCPVCILDQMSRQVRRPTVARPASQLPASALPKTNLSNFLEEYLFSRLARERADRAQVLGKLPEEVPGAEGLCLRVVSCLDKEMAVKPEFLRHFGPEAGGRYPRSFRYRSKVLMLFQRIEGVDVCLFCMYVQEYDAQQPHPNSRRIYLSYLDSIKYFRPEVMSVRNEALRTYVYHTLLVGYLDYVKRRGFATCYIWACPPLPGEDYILYCHPARQKTPKSDKLREWYLKMLAAAKAEGIVVSLGNLFDELKLDREATGEVRSATDVLYFDGDYWPGAVEEYIVAHKAEQAKLRAAGGGAGGSAGPLKRDRSGGKAKRGGTAATDATDSLDAALMGKLAESIKTMKADFIMVHLAHECCRCRRTISGEARHYAPPPGEHYELCSECAQLEGALAPEERADRRELLVEHVAPLGDTRDTDVEIECEFFDTRQNFLSMCQGNKFQFDTLRRAKHSSMMVLFHLHNPSEPAFVATCNLCARELDPGTGWRCETCSDFDMCDDCRRLRGHDPQLKPQRSRRDMTRAMSEEERRARQMQVQRTMELLVHASGCKSSTCSSSNCAKVKGLISHSQTCASRTGAQNCAFCRRLWTLLQVHAKLCTAQACPVMRCRELREYRRRQVEQAEERRRQAFAHYRQVAASGF
jgi:E1A/CREB-binding protein